MSERVKKLTWLVVLAALSVCLVLAFRHFVLEAPSGAFKWNEAGVTYELLEPRTLGVVLAAPLLLFVLLRSLADLPWPQRVLAFLLRLAFLVLLGLGLSKLVRTQETKQVCTVVLVDVSDSVPDKALDDAKAEVQRLYAAKRAEDKIRLVTFAKRPRLVELTETDGKLSKLPLERHQAAAATKGKAGGTDKPSAGSDLQAALQLAYGLLPHGYLKRVVLFSDGVETDGDLLAEVNRAKSFGAKLYTIPYRRPAPGEVALKSLVAPEKVDIGQPFDLLAQIYASRPSKLRARLYQGETLNGLDGVRVLNLKPGENEVTFKSVVRVGGEVTYALKLDQVESDTFKENNAYSVTVDVPGRPQILYVEGQPNRASYLLSALSAQQFDVDVRAVSAFPGSIKELERYNFFILSDVPREAVSISSQQLVEQYLRDLGGGFLFAGGEAGYGLGGWAHTTMERILPVRMDAERRKETPSVAMVLVIDRSGSMTGLPIEMAKAACKATVSTLKGDDLIEVIAFDSAPTRYVKMQPARYRSRIQNEIMRIQPGGGTEIFRSLDMAYQDISVVQARKKHVILLTDGNAATQGVRDLVSAMIAESITVTTVGLGNQVNSELLRMISDTGGGRYHQVPDPQSLPKVFTRETELIARQAAVEEWFPVVQTAPADFLKGIGIGGAPLLHGYVATQLKAPPAQQILASDRGEPILARWRVGLGWSLAWTSDVKNLWAVDWLRWAGFSKFWGQLVREHMRQKHRRELDMHTEVAGGRVHAVVDAFTVDERFDNFIESKLTVTGPTPKGQKRQLSMQQTAPGRYEADFELDSYGSFLLKAEHQKSEDDGSVKSVGVSYGQVSNPYPREYASFEPDLEKLRRAAKAGGGSLDPKPSEVFAPGDEKITSYEKLQDRFIFAALIVFLFDLLVRRVRIFDRKFLPRRRRRTSLAPSRRSSLPPAG